MSEFGAKKEAYESRVRWTREVRKQAEKYGFGWGYWELASFFGIYNVKDKQWDQRMLHTLLPKTD
ncbi:MAG: hypothetical protein K0Q56_12 [Sporolactobacillus laevolacticus]|jgi:endoglucanase|nr:hypothetical protein [Sporolactobacillus laevolacticus]